MGNPMLDDGQIAKAIYLRNMAAMKEVLKLGEVQLGGRDDPHYQYFKKVVMDQFYLPMIDLFQSLAERGLLERCKCGTIVRKGWKPCPSCGGSGYCNLPKLSEFLNPKGHSATP